MNYDNLSDEEVQVQLKNHDEANWTDRTGREVIEPRDVLYWLDAFGDLSLAINCQGLPKDLPDRVVEAVNEWDVLNDWHGSVEETTCPICNNTLYEFEFGHNCVFVDEWGDPHDYPEFISDYAGMYWDVTGEHHIMCQACREHRTFHGWQEGPTSNSVRIFYGGTDEFSRFSHLSGVIRWDFDWDYDFDNSTDIFNHREDDGNFIRGHEIAAAFAQGWSEKMEMMERIGFKKVHVEALNVEVKGVRRFWRYARDVLEGWATISQEAMKHESTHPDLNFTYIIEGRNQAWVPSDCVEKFEAELVWQSLREANKSEEAEEWHDSHEDLLATDWMIV
jgi:hypothetical protein